MNIRFLKDELWYGGAVKDGIQMPFDKTTSKEIDLTINKTPNQCMSILLSSKGRIIYAKDGFCVHFKKGFLKVDIDCVLVDTKGNLKTAYMFAKRNYFKFNGKMPAIELFKNPIYNTWIELIFNQNEKDILNYAQNIIKNKMPTGVIMIDDGWSECYGDWRFHTGRFPNAKEMLKILHQMGFKVMLWICPFVSPDSQAFRYAKQNDILIKNFDNEPFITNWWNGYSAVLDFSKDKTINWFKNQLDILVEMGVDGFKFDAGDSIYYKSSHNEHSNMWASFGTQYEFNEYRVTFAAGGYPLLQRLCDKQHSWEFEGIASLIPDILAQGITGHIYSCPDMIGGGEYMNFKEAEHNGLDEQIFVRHAEIACLMPAMQFSAAPYRVLKEKNFKAIIKSLDTREKYIDYILELVQKCSRTGEPIIRYMEYEFPNEGFGHITNQFMLGDRYIVAPIYKKDVCGRDVYIPKGKWFLDGKEIYGTGEKIYIQSELGKPIILKKL